MSENAEGQNDSFRKEAVKILSKFREALHGCCNRLSACDVLHDKLIGYSGNTNELQLTFEDSATKEQKMLCIAAVKDDNGNVVLEIESTTLTLKK